MDSVQYIMSKNKQAAKGDNHFSGEIDQAWQNNHADAQRPYHQQADCPEMNIEIPREIYDSEFNKNQPNSPFQ